MLAEKARTGSVRLAHEIPGVPWPSPSITPAQDKVRIAENFNDDGRWNKPLSDWGDSEQAFSRDQFWSLIEQCLAALSPRMARLFVLRELWEMETEAVCKELAITPTNLWTTLHRARLGMRQCLEKNLYV